MSSGKDGLTSAQIDELIGDQLEAQGCGCVQVSDGQVFVFTTELLERLLAASLEDGVATVFVKRGAIA